MTKKIGVTSTNDIKSGMFRGVRQCGFLPVLQSFGASPLELWATKVKSGCVRRVTDEQVRALALELASTNVSTCFIHCPKEPRKSLGIHMPYLVMIIKGVKKYFTFEITILDDRNVHRRFRSSNFQRMNRIHHFCTSMPLCLHPGWNEVYFDLANITKKAYKTNYVETTRLQIHANCRIRVIYFCDRLYMEKDIPQKLKIFLPVDHVCCRRQKAPAPKSPETRSDMFEGEYEYGEEEAPYPESMRSFGEGAAAEAQEGPAKGVPLEPGISNISFGEGEGAYPDEDDDELLDGAKASEDVKEEIKEEVKEEIKEEVKEEIKEEVKEEIKQEIKEEPEEEAAAEVKTEGAEAEAGGG